jgi:molecular chaperone HscB
MSSSDYFTLFGLDRKLRIDAADLQKRFYDLSRQWHPDRFSRKPAAEQMWALEMTSMLNDGYRTLKDPVKRAEYVLTVAGFPIGEQRGKDVPPELLEEVFDLNMMLEEIKTGDESARPQLVRAGEHFLELRAEADRELETQFAAHDAGGPGQALSDADPAADPFGNDVKRTALQAIRGILNRRRYIENLIRDVERTLDPAPAGTASAVTQ